MLNQTINAGYMPEATGERVRIALRLFDTLERNRFLSLFKIIQLESKVEFSLVDCDDANVVIIDPDEPGGEHMLHSTTQAITAVAYTDESATPYEHTIHKPVKLPALIALLDSVAVARARVAEEERALQRDATRRQVSAAEGVFDPDRGLLGLLRNKGGNGYCLIAVDGTELLYLDRVWSCYYSPLGDPKSVAAALDGVVNSEERCKETPLADDAFKQIIDKNGFQHHPLESLIWAITLSHSGGARLRGMDEGRALQLKQWPNLIKLPHRPEHARLCALLVQHPSTIDSAVAKIGMDEASVTAFINACAALQLMRYQEAPASVQEEVRVDAGRKALLSNIVKRLFG